MRSKLTVVVDLEIRPFPGEVSLTVSGGVEEGVVYPWDTSTRPKSSLTSSRFSLLCVDRGGGLADYVNDDVGFGEHDDVAAVRLGNGRR